MRNTIRDRATARFRALADRRAEPGQIFIMFAVFATGMIGVLGLSMDVGFAVSQSRSMQNAADAGALAGAHIVATSRNSSAQSDVEDIVRKNALNPDDIDSITCIYVNDADSSLGGCANSVPSGATGVQVTVDETHSTFFIKVIPGAPDSVTTGADATAHVKKLKTPASDGPFLPCGVGSKMASGSQVDLAVKSGNVWTINPDAVGRTFQIHGPQIAQCDSKSSRFKGFADTEANAGLTAPGWFQYNEGVKAGHIDNNVAGPNGCKSNEVVEDCVVFLPVIVNDPEETGNNRKVWAVAFAPFYVTSPKKNEHYGKLLDDYIIYGLGDAGELGWAPGYIGPITIRLTE